MISGGSPEDTHERYLHRYAGDWHPHHDEDTHFDHIEEHAVVRHLSRVVLREEPQTDEDETKKESES